MFDIADFFKKKPSSDETVATQPQEGGAIPSADSKVSDRGKVVSLRNWYEERYDTIVMQRNILLIMVMVCIVGIVVSVMSVTKIATSKKFDPFVIQIDEKTGSAKVVTPVAEDILTRDDSITRYFIKKYIIAREGYNPVDFSSGAMETVRVLSHPMIFMLYKSYINGQDTNPVTRYGQTNTTYVTIKSWSRIEEKKYLVRFAIHETAGGKKVYNKIAVVLIDYVSMELKESERDVNPLGFQVMGYGVNDDDS